LLPAVVGTLLWGGICWGFAVESTPTLQLVWVILAIVGTFGLNGFLIFRHVSILIDEKTDSHGDPGPNV
jgi:hypothetical protein